jgi:putative tryptophan/tyrosine transport system substrate-binding protein
LPLFCWLQIPVLITEVQRKIVTPNEAIVMRRREFIAGLGTAVTAVCPFVARAQDGGRMRRVGVLTPWREDDPDARAWLSAFLQRLAELRWNEGHNLHVDVRWAAGDPDRVRMYAKELVELQPDVILVDSTPQTAALQRETRTIPIVFVAVSDPVGSGFVASFASPTGNITGFTHYEPTLGGKWVELVTDMAPDRRRIAAMFNPETAPYVRRYYLPLFEAAARTLKLEPIVAPVHSDVEIEAAIIALGREPGGGLVVMPDAFVQVHRASIILAAALNNLPAVSYFSAFVRDGGLLSYGADYADLYRSAAPYVDRILRGEKPSELPVQLPTKFVMAVNVKTAKALGLTVPPSIQLRANEVIE